MRDPALSAAIAADPSPTIEVRTGTSPEQWDAYVATRAGASFYHRAAWAGVIERSFGHTTRYLTAWSGGAIVGVLPLVLCKTWFFGRFITSMPFVNYGGVVADPGDAAAALLSAAIDAAKATGSSSLELRHVDRMFPDLPARTHKVAMVLSLQPTVDGQWQGLDRKLRNQVRKAEKSGLTVASGGVELLDAFYDVLAHNMRDLGSPVHAKRFFRDVLTTFREESRVFVVSLESKPIAASVVLWRGAQLEVPWASAMRAYNPLCPNVLLYWAMLKFGIERGFARFDFGRSTPLEGTYQFKQQWGAAPEPLHWEYWLSGGQSLPDRGPTNPKFMRAIALWRRLPVAVTRAIGPWIVRNIP